MSPRPGRPIYRNPPLVEAIIAFRFQPSASGWDSIYFGKIHQQIQDDFPEVETIGGIEFQFNLATPSAPHFMPAPEVKRFKRGDGGVVVSVGPEMLGVSVLPQQMEGGYQGWERVSEAGLRLLRIYQEIVQPGRIQQVGVRYINALATSPQQFRLGKFVSDKSGMIPVRLLQETNPSSFRYEHIVAALATYVHREVLQISAQPVPENVARLVVDIDEIWQPVGQVEPEVEMVCNMLHDAADKVFHTVFRPEIKAQFGPVTSRKEAQK